MTMNHTPKPWVLHKKGTLRWVDAERICIAEIPEDEDGDAQEGNARLIAAAPDLLAALKWVNEQAVEDSPAMWSAVSEAIRKAETGDA